MGAGKWDLPPPPLPRVRLHNLNRFPDPFPAPSCAGSKGGGRMRRANLRYTAVSRKPCSRSDYRLGLSKTVSERGERFTHQMRRAGMRIIRFTRVSFLLLKGVNTKRGNDSGHACSWACFSDICLTRLRTRGQATNEVAHAVLLAHAASPPTLSPPLSHLKPIFFLPCFPRFLTHRRFLGGRGRSLFCDPATKNIRDYPVVARLLAPAEARALPGGSIWRARGRLLAGQPGGIRPFHYARAPQAHGTSVCRSFRRALPPCTPTRPCMYPLAPPCFVVGAGGNARLRKSRRRGCFRVYRVRSITYTSGAADENKPA